MLTITAQRPLLLALAVATAALGLEFGRVLAARNPGWELTALVVGGVGLCLLAAGRAPAQLGLGVSRLGLRCLGGLALAVVLLLPAAVRWGGGPELGAPLAVAAVSVSIGEEVAFRGVLFAALDELGGPLLAIAGSTLLWTLAHALSHPPGFLPAVAAAGLLLGLWRWVCRDLVAPLIGHCLADLAL